MNITDVKVIKKEVNQLKGFATIVIDDSLIIKNIKIIQGREGLFIAMPSYKLKNGEFKDIVHPLNSQTRELIQDLILSKYNEEEAEEEKTYEE